MKAIIIEDEAPAIQKLKRTLAAVRPDYEVIREAGTIEDGVKLLQTTQPDIIFCDIHLGDGLSFRIFEEHPTKIPIVFTTAYDQYAIRAFKVNSISYLLKPVGKPEMEAALNKFESLHSDMDVPVDFSALAEAISAIKKEYRQRITVHIGDRLVPIELSEVRYFYAEGKYVFMVMPNGKEHIIDFTLDKLMNCLDPNTWFRINRQFIVCLLGIDEMYTWTKSRVKLGMNPPSKKDVIVSVERSGDFKRWLNR